MNKKSKYLLLSLYLILFVLSGCGDFFGKKTDLSFIEVPKYDSNLVAYIPVPPFLYGFQDPVQVLYGYDELIYVVDAGTDEIIAFDQAHRRLGSFHLSGVQAIAQDRRLNILAIAHFDTTISGKTYRLPAIYRLNLYQNGQYGIQHARIVKKIVHPFYFRTTFLVGDTQVVFHRIAVFGNNDYLVTRHGPDNANPTKVGGPDDAVLLFNQEDQWLGFVIVNTSQGEIRDYFKYPYGVTTFAVPPQSPYVSLSRDFVVTMLSPNLPLKVQYIRLVQTEQGSVYELNTDLVVGDTTRADGFLYTPNRFGAPTGITVSGDGTNYLFVSDTLTDSVYVFTFTGLEGVKPPPTSPSTKYVKVSFGGTGSGPFQFIDPTSLTYLNKLLYVCDRGNKRILRFRLTTDFD